MAAVRRTSLRRMGSVADQADPINRAVDVLMAGVAGKVFINAPCTAQEP